MVGGSQSKPSPKVGQLSWGELKAMIDELVADHQLIFQIDIGPDVKELFVYSDSAGVEIADAPIHY